MMKRKRILAGLIAAVLLAVSGCGSGHLAAETESLDLLRRYAMCLIIS